MNDLQCAFAVISLSITSALCVLWAVLLLHWSNGLKLNPVKHTDWLVLGVCTSFIGVLGDNLWWAFAWYHRLRGHDEWTWWFDNGVISNVIFRQGIKAISAYCHLKAAVAFGAMTEEELDGVCKLSIAVFAVSVWILVAL